MSTRVLDFDPTMLPVGPAVAAIGVFDGVHAGHQELVRTARHRARELGVASVVITFDRDPDRVVAPDTAAPQLLEIEDKIAFLSDLDPDAVLVVPFDHATAALSPEEFVTRVVLAACTPVIVAVGHDFRFGRGAAGDVHALTRIGSSHGFDVLALPLVTISGVPVTSTRIRALIAEGRVREAACLLGRPHRVRGRVVHGRGRGARLGVPTANVLPRAYAAVPAHGVYAARAAVGERVFPAAVSVGAPPTFPGSENVVEVHLIDEHGTSLYGTEIAVDFVERLRDLKRFDDESSLVSAIRTDIERARALLGSGESL